MYPTFKVPIIRLKPIHFQWQMVFASLIMSSSIGLAATELSDQGLEDLAATRAREQVFTSQAGAEVKTAPSHAKPSETSRPLYREIVSSPTSAPTSSPSRSNSSRPTEPVKRAPEHLPPIHSDVQVCIQSLKRDFPEYPIDQLCMAMEKTGYFRADANSMASIREYLSVQSPNYLTSGLQEDSSPWFNRKINQLIRDLAKDDIQPLYFQQTRQGIPYKVIGQQYIGVQEGVTRKDGMIATITGLSGLFFDPTVNKMYSISDNRQRPDLFVSDLRLQADGRAKWVFTDHKYIAVNFQGAVDFEDLVRLKDGSILIAGESDASPITQLDCKGDFVGSPFNRTQVQNFLRGISEGNPSKSRAPITSNPERPGFFDRALNSIKNAFSEKRKGEPAKKDIKELEDNRDWSDVFVHNKSLEALTISQDRSTIFTTPENPPYFGNYYTNETPLYSFKINQTKSAQKCQTSPVRFSEMKVIGKIPLSNEVFQLRTGGISAILQVSPKKFLILERAYDRQADRVVGRIFAIYTDRLTASGQFQKFPFIELADLEQNLAPGFRHMDNLEGMTIGPDLQGKKTLVLVSDNNNNPAQVTMLLTLLISKEDLEN